MFSGLPLGVIPQYSFCCLASWVRVFRVVPKFRILRLTFHAFDCKVGLKTPKLFCVIFVCLRVFEFENDYIL